MLKILVIQQKMIGDVLTSTIICESLKKQYPDARIDYLVNSGTIPVIQGNPFLDTIIEFKNEYRENKKKLFSFLQQIKRKEYDMVIDAYGKLESNLISLFSKAPKKVSFYKWYTQFLYTQTIHRKKKSLTNASIAIENRLRLVVSEENISKQIFKPKIFLTEEEKERALAYLTSNAIATDKQLIMISVLGSQPSKSLPFEYMAKIIDEIVSVTDAQILFNYIPSQEKDAHTIYSLTTLKTQNNIHLDVFAKNLRGFLAVLSHCDILVGNEGGAVNMAKALNIPTFTVFSPWIDKNDWNIFEDGKKHMSVHLKDYKPLLFEDKTSKELKKQSLELYSDFSNTLFSNQLQEFLLKNL